MPEQSHLVRTDQLADLESKLAAARQALEMALPHIQHVYCGITEGWPCSCGAEEARRVVRNSLTQMNRN